MLTRTDYYTHDLSGLIVDQRVLRLALYVPRASYRARRLVKSMLPHLDAVLDNYNIELSLVTVNW